MKLIVLGSLAAVAATVVSANDQYQQEDNEEFIPEDEDPFTSRSLAASPVPFPVLAMLTVMNFVNALQENWSEEEFGREGDLNGGSNGGRWGSGVWKAVKNVPTVLYETSSMMAPLTLRYMMAEDSEHPHCQQLMLCELNTKVKQRFGKPGEIAMQLASSMAGYALGGKDNQKYDSLVDAARNGRRGKECHELYPKCTARNDSGSAMPALLNLASRLIKN